MSFFGCKHKWVEKRREIHRPDPTFESASGVSRAALPMLEKIMHGYTLIELECEYCHKIDASTLIGMVKKP